MTISFNLDHPPLARRVASQLNSSSPSYLHHVLVLLAALIAPALPQFSRHNFVQIKVLLARSRPINAIRCTRLSPRAARGLGSCRRCHAEAHCLPPRCERDACSGAFCLSCKSIRRTVPSFRCLSFRHRRSSDHNHAFLPFRSVRLCSKTTKIPSTSGNGSVWLLGRCCRWLSIFTLLRCLNFHTFEPV